VYPRNDGNAHLFTGGSQNVLGLVLPGYLKAVDETHEGDVLTPMPCKISQELVKVGQEFKNSLGGNEDGACHSCDPKCDR
jgi:hypothetical protein